jgi:hypothetical protein
MKARFIYDREIIHVTPALTVFPFPWGWSVQLSWLVWTVDVSRWKEFPDDVEPEGRIP